MQANASTEDLAMTLVEQALLHPESEREKFLRGACGPNTTLFGDAWEYVQWEERMQGFLQEPIPAAAEPRPFLPGQILIHRFRIIREIAEGGMGIVWEAIDEKLDRRVALKCAKGTHGKQLPPEVRNAREISHPNVCKIYEIHTAAGEGGEFDFISMEFLEGETLADRLQRGPVPEGEAYVIARQLCSGLAEAHRNLLIHGDLKTNNVILTKDFGGTTRSVITDFGLARKFDGSVPMLGGTPAYMAPELWKGQTPSIQSDIYALGVMLWELRSGKAPGALGVNTSTIETGEERTGWKPPPGRGKWNRVVARCLNPEPKARFKSAADVARALGPSRALQWMVAVSLIAVVAGVSGVVTYNQATAPTERVALALRAEGDVPRQLIRDAADQLKHLRGSEHTEYRFAPQGGSGTKATHALKLGVERHGEAFAVHSVLTDLRSGVNARDWTGEYQANQMDYAPQALAGFVTETLHLPPPATGKSLSASAEAPYKEGMASLQRDETLNEALEQFGRAALADPRSALPYAGLAEAQFLKYSQTYDTLWLERSAESVRQAQLRNPDFPHVHQVAGLLDRAAGLFDAAVGEFKRALEIAPDNDDAYRRLALTYEDKGALDDALAAFKKALEIGPKNFKNYRELGNFYGRRANFAMQIKQFQSALALAPNNADILYRLGVVYKDTGQFDASEQAFRASLRLKETPRILHALGVLLLAENKNSEAAEAISRAIRTGTPQHNWWSNLGTAEERLGHAKEAKVSYLSALALAEKELAENPSDALVRSHVGLICARLHQEQRALSESRQALAHPPTDAVVLSVVATTYEALNRRQETLSVLAKAPGDLLLNLSRWPEMAELSRDPRFIKLLESHERKKEK